MNYAELFFTAKTALLHRKGRTMLTMLGIIIGISAIIVTMSIGKGAEQAIADKIFAMGENYLYVHRGTLKSVKSVKGHKSKASKNLTLKDVEAIKSQITAVYKISPMNFTQATISFGGKILQIQIKSGNEDMLGILNRRIIFGYSFLPEHQQQAARVIVLGQLAAQELFGRKNPVGELVKLEGQLFKVIGVLARIENYFGIMDPNMDSYIPFATAKRYLLKEKNNNVAAIAISALTKDTVPKVYRQVRRVLRATRNLAHDSEDDFTIVDQQSIETAAKGSAQIIMLLLLIIASIALLVGGIGVMNIMLVCVSERTREIGIRMALGAKQQDILKQFLCEAVLLCLIGGIIGVSLGVSFSFALGKIIGWKILINWWSVLFSFGLTTGVGIFFGFYPARLAAQLSPVDALADK